MELWNYFEILKNKRQDWLVRKANVEVRLTALFKILELATPSYIQNLIPFLEDNEHEIQNGTCYVIIQLFQRINNKKDYYDFLKHCDISKATLDFYEHHFIQDQFSKLLAIASLNKNGYIREKAVYKLAETGTETAIPFIIYRLADWVPEVRKCAKKGLEKFRNSHFLKPLVDNLEIIERLQSVERVDLSPVLSDMMEFIVVQNKPFITENFTTFRDKPRLILAKKLLSAENSNLADLKLLLNDRHFMIRSQVLMHFDKLTEIETGRLLNDKSARIRLQALYKLKHNDHYPAILFSFLADNSATIREFSRHFLKNTIHDFSAIYNKNLEDNKFICGSLSGLGEINATQYAETIIKFLYDTKIKVRKAAFLALKKLDKNKAYQAAFENLDSEHIGLRNLAIDYLAVLPTPEIVEKARTIYKDGSFDLKKSMLGLFNKIGKWTTIADIMIGTIDENEAIRHLSLMYLKRWKAMASTYYTQPKSGELERANRIFEVVFEIHQDNHFFEQNPLTGIDFYLR